MTEAEWFSSNEAAALRDHLGSRASRRKLGLVACATARLVAQRFDHPRTLSLIKIAERFADGQCAARKYQRACAQVQHILEAYVEDQDFETACEVRNLRICLEAVDERAFVRRLHDQRTSLSELAAYPQFRDLRRISRLLEPVFQKHAWELMPADSLPLTREVFGNPFRQHSVDEMWRSWREAAIPKLAQAAYDKRESPSAHLKADRLAVLADALEEAGCDDQEMLGHLRGPGPHVRGCWVVDLLLGKD